MSYINLLDILYPVGSLYFSMNSQSPAEIIGGNWTPVEGRFLLGVSNEYPVGDLKGEKIHTLVEAELPSHRHQTGNHNHSVPNHTHSSSNGGSIMVIGSSSHEVKGLANGANWADTYIGRTTYVGGGACTTGNSAPYTTYTGTNTAHNNMPPYLAVYIWYRVS